MPASVTKKPYFYITIRGTLLFGDPQYALTCSVGWNKGRERYERAGHCTKILRRKWLGHSEQHHFRFNGDHVVPFHREWRRCVVLHREIFAFASREIENQINALTRRDQQITHLEGGR